LVLGRLDDGPIERSTELMDEVRYALLILRTRDLAGIEINFDGVRREEVAIELDVPEEDPQQHRFVSRCSKITAGSS
jgi:hypothetical protein